MSYRYMRMILMFDMPTDTAEERKAYRKFRKFLLNEGFIMHQFSIYSKLLLNNTANKAMVDRLQENNPKKGNITLLTVTEKQFSRMIYLHGDKDTSVANSDERVVFLGEAYDVEDLFSHTRRALGFSARDCLSRRGCYRVFFFG